MRRTEHPRVKLNEVGGIVFHLIELKNIEKITVRLSFLPEGIRKHRVSENDVECPNCEAELDLRPDNPHNSSYSSRNPEAFKLREEWRIPDSYNIIAKPPNIGDRLVERYSIDITYIENGIERYCHFKNIDEDSAKELERKWV